MPPLLPPQPTKRQDKREVDMNECYRKTHIKILLPPQPTKRQDKREVDLLVGWGGSNVFMCVFL